MREYLLLELSIALMVDIKILAKLFLFFLKKKMGFCAAVIFVAAGYWCQLFYKVHGKRAELINLRSLAA